MTTNVGGVGILLQRSLAAYRLALAALVAGFARVFSHASLPMVSAYFGYGIVAMFLSAVTARIRKMLD
jgi:hypothetical protein